VVVVAVVPTSRHLPLQELQHGLSLQARPWLGSASLLAVLAVDLEPGRLFLLLELVELEAM
jgi:hypothetical protein